MIAEQIANRDISEVSIALMRADPAEPGFFSKADDPTPWETCVATLATALRRQVANGTLSQSEADKKLEEYRSRPFELPPGAQVFMSAYTDNDAEISRPGVSQEFLRVQKIVRVDNEQAQNLLGSAYHYNCSGIWLPYHNPFNTGPVMAQGRPFGRVRLDNPRNGTKYLSPKNGGAQLYVPLKGGPFGSELVICEGEFKAAALCDAGIRAVAVGGISSAMDNGVLIRDLAKLIDCFEPKQIKFIGDADTALNYAFSREAVKIARALPSGCTFSLPRVPIGMPNGIDDCREQLGDEFPEFWERINNESIVIDADIPIGALATKIVKRELPNLVKHEDREHQLHKLSKLASWFDPLSLESLASAVHEVFGCSIPAFRESAKQVAAERKAAAEAAAQKDEEHARAHSRGDVDVAEIINDPRPKIEIPASRNRLSSEFARELGAIVADKGFFAKDGVVVRPDEKNASLLTVEPAAFRTMIEDHVIPFKVFRGLTGDRTVFRTLSREEADTVLHSDQFIKKLPVIRTVNNVRLPVVRSSGNIELLADGYDVESQTFTTPGGPEIEDPGFERSVAFLTKLFSEFCFQESDEDRATSVAISAMLTLFVFNIIPRGAIRPGFFYTANAEGGGKTLLARLAIIPRMGSTSTGPLPAQEEEIEKRVFAAAVAGSSVLLFDNSKRHVSSGALESALTASVINGRILGRSQMLHIENMMTVFLTGNGSTISGDLRRRLLHVELFLRESRSEHRQIENPLNEFSVQNLRPAILSALWGITHAWAVAGRPAPKLRKPDYEPWSDVVCGILEHARFVSPCVSAPTTVSGDRDTEDMENLVAAMSTAREYRFPDIVELCHEQNLFTRLVGGVADEDDSNEADKENTDDEKKPETSKADDKERGKKNILGRIFSRFRDRIFPGNRTFHIERRRKSSVFFIT